MHIRLFIPVTDSDQEHLHSLCDIAVEVLISVRVYHKYKIIHYLPFILGDILGVNVCYFGLTFTDWVKTFAFYCHFN